MPGMESVVAELTDEDHALLAVLEDLSDDRWDAPSLAEGWSIRDQVSHLADTNEICIDTVTGGARALGVVTQGFESAEAFTESGCERGRALEPAEVLAWFRSTAKAQQDVLAACDVKQRVPWGLGMSAPMMATARLMEHWAHGYDIRGGLGLGPLASPRLRSIAFLVVRAVPYALMMGGVTSPPAGTLRAELTYEGETWSLGPEDADNLIAGDALEFCILGIRRIKRAEATTLKAHGPLAEVALDNLRAFL